MKRSMSLQESADLPYTSRPVSITSDDNTISVAVEQQGLIHLLENNTLEELEEMIEHNHLIENYEWDDSTTEDSQLSDDDRHRGKGMFIDGIDKLVFLHKGRLPEEELRRNGVANWVMSLDEPNLQLALLKLGNIQISIKDHSPVQALVAAASLDLITVFSDIVLCLECNCLADKDVMFDTLVTLIELNQGFNGIMMSWDRVEDEGDHIGERNRKSLFDALSKTTEPKIITAGRYPMPEVYLRHLASLLDANATVHTLSLKHLNCSSWTDDAKDVHQMLLQRLKKQTRLQLLSIAGITARDHEQIGEFVGNSHTLKYLHIDVTLPFSAPSLVNGLKKNRSLATLELGMRRVADRGRLTKEHNALHLLEVFANNSCSARELTLNLHHCPAEDISALINIESEFDQGQTFIESLLRRNTTLNSLTMNFPSDTPVNLLPIGRGIMKNRTLESLHILCSWHGLSYPLLQVDAATLPSFLARVAKNETLLNISVEGISGRDSKDSETLEGIVLRNRHLQKYACSSAYLRGAVSGFLVTKEVTTDLVEPLSTCLEGSQSLADSRALAGINKASNNWALASRREESAIQLKTVLEAPLTDLKAGKQHMVKLLGMVLVRKQDFDDEVLQQVARSIFFTDALIYWLRENRLSFATLAKRLNEVPGMQISRNQLIRDFLARDKDRPGIDKQLQRLEHLFRPDQSHLARYMNEKVDYESIEQDELEAFVGYDIVDPASDHKAVFDWCVEHAKAELYAAYMARLPSVWLSTYSMPLDFRRRCLSALASHRQVSRLHILDFGQQGDVAAVDALLSGGSLECLTLTNALCAEATFTLFLVKLAANTTFKQLSIHFYHKLVPYPLIEKIRQVFQANQSLERLILEVPSFHFEYALLEELARVENRFQLLRG